MKKILLIGGVFALMAISAVSCRNGAGKTPEEEQAQATALADSVIAQVDSLYSSFLEHSLTVNPLDAILTDSEKASKPLGLFDLTAVDTLTTTSQKTSALAFANIDNWVCMAHGDNSKTEPVIARLAAEFNFPESEVKNDTISVAQNMLYSYCKKNDLLDYFWRFEYSMLVEISNVLASNPRAYLTKMTPSQLATFEDSWNDLEQAISILAKYDTNMSKLYDIVINYSALVKPEGGLSAFTSMEDAIASFAAAKPKFEQIREKLLQ